MPAAMVAKATIADRLLITSERFPAKWEPVRRGRRVKRENLERVLIPANLKPL
jgi:hypothetical protein